MNNFGLLDIFLIEYIFSYYFYNKNMTIIIVQLIFQIIIYLSILSYIFKNKKYKSIKYITFYI